MQVRYTPRDASDPAAVAANLPAGAERLGDAWHFAIEDDGVEPLLARITASGHGAARCRKHDIAHHAFGLKTGRLGNPDQQSLFAVNPLDRSEEHTSELQSLTRLSYA